MQSQSDYQCHPIDKFQRNQNQTIKHNGSVRDEGQSPSSITSWPKTIHGSLEFSLAALIKGLSGLNFKSLIYQWGKKNASVGAGKYVSTFLLDSNQKAKAMKQTSQLIHTWSSRCIQITIFMQSLCHQVDLTNFAFSQVQLVYSNQTWCHHQKFINTTCAITRKFYYKI